MTVRGCSWHRGVCTPAKDPIKSSPRHCSLRCLRKLSQGGSPKGVWVLVKSNRCTCSQGPQISTIAAPHWPSAEPLPPKGRRGLVKRRLSRPLQSSPSRSRISTRCRTQCQPAKRGRGCLVVLSIRLICRAGPTPGNADQHFSGSRQGRERRQHLEQHQLHQGDRRNCPDTPLERLPYHSNICPWLTSGHALCCGVGVRLQTAWRKGLRPLEYSPVWLLERFLWPDWHAGEGAPSRC